MLVIRSSSALSLLYFQDLIISNRGKAITFHFASVFCCLASNCLLNSEYIHYVEWPQACNKESVRPDAVIFLIYPVLFLHTDLSC